MKKFLHNPYLSLFARLLLGSVFIYASIDKLQDPAPFASSIGNYKIISAELSIIAATILPWLEILCGISLLLGIFVKGSSMTLTLLLFIFTIAVISALARSLDISCGCFTQDPGAQKMGWEKVVENVGLLLLSLYLLFSTNHRYALNIFWRNAKNSTTN